MSSECKKNGTLSIHRPAYSSCLVTLVFCAVRITVCPRIFHMTGDRLDLLWVVWAGDFGISHLVRSLMAKHEPTMAGEEDRDCATSFYMSGSIPQITKSILMMIENLFSRGSPLGLICRLGRLNKSLNDKTLLQAFFFY